jgi:hypothetical protein
MPAMAKNLGIKRDTELVERKPFFPGLGLRKFADDRGG